MTRFTTLYPQFVGFDQLFNELERIVEGQAVPKLNTFPPHNVLKVDDSHYVVEMAVAGFAKTDIEVTLEGNKLVVNGAAKEDETDTSEYLFKGIANRGFNHEFKIADKIEIENAELANGMLKIWLSNMVKAQDLIKKIPLVSKD